MGAAPIFVHAVSGLLDVGRVSLSPVYALCICMIHTLCELIIAYHWHNIMRITDIGGRVSA